MMHKLFGSKKKQVPPLKTPSKILSKTPAQLKSSLEIKPTVEFKNPALLKRPPKPYEAERKDTLILEAARADNLEQLKTLLHELKENQHYLIRELTTDRDTAAHLAARHGHLACLNLLLSFNAGGVYSLSLLDENSVQETPLHELVKKGYVEKLDASTQQSYKDTITELVKDNKYFIYWLHRCAAKYGLVDLMKELAPKVSPAETPWYPKVLPISDAVRANQAIIVDWLVTEYKHDANLLHTLLKDAARYNALDVVKSLLKAGASVRWSTWSGELVRDDSAYHDAATWGHLEVLKCLIQHDPKVLASKQFYETLAEKMFDCTFLANHVEMVKYLNSVVSLDVSEFARKKLDSAAFYGKIDTLKYYIEEYKPERPVTDKIDFRACLRSAVIHCQTATVKWLVAGYNAYCKEFLPEVLALGIERYETDPYLRDEKELMNIIEFFTQIIKEPVKEATAVISMRR